MDLGQVFTNKIVAEYMASLFCLNKDAEMLDPCFGGGVFVEAFIKQGYSNITGYEIDEHLFTEVSSNYSGLELYNKDFLSINSNRKYDGILMNPPYIRQEKINDLKPYGITKNILRSNIIFSSLPSTANIYMYFIFKAIDLLKNDGELVVIFPSSWLQAKSGKIFEELLYAKCTLKEQIHISGQVFDKDALVDVVILHLVKGKNLNQPVIKNIEMKNDILIENVHLNKVIEIDFKVPFSKVAKVRRGLTTGFNAMYINPEIKGTNEEQYLKSIISSPKSIIGYSTVNAKTDTLFVPGTDEALSIEVQKYVEKWAETIRESKQPKTLFNKLNKGNKWYHLPIFDAKGILFSYFVRNDMKFIFNSSSHLVRDNFYIIYPKIDKLLLFSLLNNYYTFYQLEQLGKKYGAGLLKLQRYDIEELMFPDIEIFTGKEKMQLAKLAQTLIDTGDNKIIEQITKIISAHSQIDYESIVKGYIKIKTLRLEGCTNEK